MHQRDYPTASHVNIAEDILVPALSAGAAWSCASATYGTHSLCGPEVRSSLVGTFEGMASAVTVSSTVYSCMAG